MADLSLARKQAWETRRLRYGPKGHSGYSQSTSRAGKRAIDRALEEIGQARRQCQMMLPDAAAHKAITFIDWAEWILKTGSEPDTRMIINHGR